MEPLLDHLETFVAFVRKRTGDAELAADVVQSALAKALARKDQLQDEPRLLAWFWRILRNTLAEVQRRGALEKRAMRELPEQVDDLPQDAKQAVCACLDAAVATLPTSERDALRQVDLAGRDPVAVATELEITTNNLNVRRHRARQSLRAVLQATCRLCAAHGCLDCDCQPPGSP
jgi:RNA polymerase sigma-70 factor (ECF subfamily)